MQMSPPVNRISLSNNEIGPTCRFLNWSQACPGQMCKQEHVVLVLEIGVAMPRGGGLEGKITWQATEWRTRQGWRASPVLHISHAQVPVHFRSLGRVTTMSPKPAPEADLEWPPWSGCGKAHFKLAILRVLIDALTSIWVIAWGTQVTPHLERFCFPSFIPSGNPPEMQSKEQKLMFHVLYYPLGILRKCGCHCWQRGAEFTTLPPERQVSAWCFLLRNPKWYG